MVAENGQVACPKALRNRLGIRTAQVLEFHAEQGWLVALKVAEQDAASSVFGILDLGKSADRVVDELRRAAAALSRAIEPGSLPDCFPWPAAG